MSSTVTVFTVTRTLGAAGVAAPSLLLAQVALAEAPVSRFTAADQAAAKAVVLKARDVAAGMRGGLEKNAKAPSATGCPGLWEPRQSDLAITGGRGCADRRARSARASRA
jgi:hypothetical protein